MTYAILKLHIINTRKISTDHIDGHSVLYKIMGGVPILYNDVILWDNFNKFNLEAILSHLEPIQDHTDVNRKHAFRRDDTRSKSTL